MTYIIAVANQKGGVGKTTSAVNLSASLAATKRRTLLIDLDPQGNATMGCGVNKRDLEITSGDVLLGNISMRDAIIKREEMEFDLLPSNDQLTAADSQLRNEDVRETRLRKAIDSISYVYQYIVIDCPPSLNLLTINALVAADGVLIPTQCEYYALEGLTDLLETIDSIRASFNPNLDIDGILRTMYDPRSNLANDVSSQLIYHFGEKVYGTTIPRNIRLAEAPSFGVPALLHDKRSRGAMAYLALAGEINRRNEISAQSA